jgi:hypothetical protein
LGLKPLLSSAIPNATMIAAPDKYAQTNRSA